MPTLSENSSEIIPVLPSYETHSIQGLMRRFGYDTENLDLEFSPLQKLSLFLFRGIHKVEQRMDLLQRLEGLMMSHLDRNNPRHQIAIRATIKRLYFATNQLERLLAHNTEQSRIRRLIHDVRGHLVTALVNFELLSEREFETVELVREAIDATRCALRTATLRPERWANLGEYLNQISTVRIRSNGLERLEKSRLSRDSFCDIISTSGLNSKRAGAKSVWVTTTESDNFVILTITDDGPGFTQEPGVINLLARGGYGSTGNGIPTINHLCEDAGGKLKLSNHPNKEYGALLTIELPKL